MRRLYMASEPSGNQSGNPPATVAWKKAMLRSVAADPNAVGYVPAGEVDDSVRVALRLD